MNWKKITNDIDRDKQYIMAFIDEDGLLTAVWWAHYDTTYARWREVYTEDMIYPTHYIELPGVET